jgi:hypothetical protein
MPFPHNVYKTQRIVPIRFKRAVTGAPVLDIPDIDDRGWFRPDPAGNNAATNDHGFVVGLTEGQHVYISVEREKIEGAATLFVKSSDETVMTVKQNLGADQLNPGSSTLVRIDGVSGGAGAIPKIARVQVHFGTNTGPIIAELSVWVYRNVNVNLVPHNVTIQTAAGGDGVASAANITTVMDTVKMIWKAAAVGINVAAIQNHTVTFATAGVANWQAEINTLLSTSWVPGSINAYFVNQILMPGVPGILGLGISRPNSVAFGTPNPGIILGDTSGGASRAADSHYLANDIAHEMGHFFTLPHVDNINNTATAQGREEIWALRMLMHPTNTHFFRDFRNDTGYGVAGDGTGYRGSLITLKDLVDSGNAAHHSTDAEVKTSRTAITSVAGPY